MKKFATPLLILLTFGVYGQQEIQFTQFMQNKLYYNPGVSGASGSIALTGVHRSQWVGFDNAPTTQNFNVSAPINLLHGGIGVSITNDQIGNFKDITAGISYAYQMQLGNGQLGIGVQADFRNKNVISGAEWITPDGMLESGIPTGGASDMAIDVNFGLYYQTADFWGGVSTTRMIEAVAELEGSVGGISKFKGKRNYIFMGGYNYPLSNTNIVLQPALLLKTDFVATSADINLAATYNNKIWGGVSYRLGDALGLMAGYYITPDFKITYSYDLTLSQLKSASSGSHEILIGYSFKIEIQEKEPGYYRDPRFL